MAFENLFPYLGHFGRYQKRIYVLLCLTAVTGALHKLVGVFLQASVNYRCQLPFENETASYTLPPEILNMSYPWDEREYAFSSCQMLAANYTEDYFHSGRPSNESVTCTQWIYDKSIYTSSTIMEFDLVCTYGWLPAMSDSMFMLGDVIGSFTFGLLSDRYGRKPIFMVAVVMQVIAGLLVSFSPQYVWFIIFRLFVGSTVSGLFLVGYVIAMEMVGTRKRLFAGVACQLFFTFGYVITALFAYLIPEWRLLQIAITVPSLIFLSYWWIIPESFRWLTANGQQEEARKYILKAAKENGVTIPDDVLTKAIMGEGSVRSENNSQKYSIIDMMKHSKLRRRTLNIFFIWFANNATYYGLSWNTSNLGGNDYINFLIAGFVEVPAYTFLLFSLNKWGRKKILCSSMIIAGVSLFAATAVPQGTSWLVVTFAMLGKLAITASYGTIYIFTAEQFPTVVRNVALGASSTCARMGGMAAPYINVLNTIWRPLPLLIFGTVSTTAAFLALILPETLNRKLPDTIEDMEEQEKPLSGASIGDHIDEVPKESI
ncbi:organic cation transporter protein-like [Schistocerca serialis cubense]|uniref:organic cation transporter protein-like n=1 Tax=Schistocerca serialis cubense TaxID=2023355 RepID=UPI00214E6D21|nr:organic cation transporter protein-like [Schistocerca serialis cubense]